MKLKSKTSRANVRMIVYSIVGMTISMMASSDWAQQISIPRIDEMPSMPSPYEMRNWKRVAMGYDSLVFDLTSSGDYLPLVWIDGNTINYPDHDRFGLHTYVGTSHPAAAEAINVIPAVIGATLVGVDKSNQYGIDWVLMCEEFFNKRPEENVYLNGFVAISGSDWWYDTMPNVYFYQLYHLYPHTGDFDYQFSTVADRWFEAVVAMGGSATPWNVPSMNYRAWSLSTMTPLSAGVKEPEAAGAIGWILYNAFVESGEDEYRIGAEWAMEFLNSRSKNQNPSYELQLPYGVYAAARMNAELGTNYNVEKMVNWCFDPDENVREWGATLGNWGGYDCYGLIGEAEYTGYAFVMNGFDQVGALVPMVRYDDRFATAIGKWVLNCANATRLFYPAYLPEGNQDSEEWADAYDPGSTIAHEAMREYALHTGISPYATGDAMGGGWAHTNLALYGSSHVGIFGGIIDTTNVDMILRLDALKTDYFYRDAYPTYLYFNPYDEEKSVEIDVGSGLHDLYDAVSNTFLQTGVSGITSFSVPADAAVFVVMTPSGGAVTYDLDKTIIDGVIVDYRSGQSVANYPPRIKSLAAESTVLVPGTTTTLYCTAVDKEGDDLFYTWSGSSGNVTENDSEMIWTAPDTAGTYSVECRVDDGKGGQDSAHVNIQVVESINHAPVISRIAANPGRIHLGGMSELHCSASDPDGDTLSYAWSAEYGNLSSSDSTATWIAPLVQGMYTIGCRVEDGRGGQASDSTGIVVQDTSNIATGVPVAYYPFDGDANDESGFDNHGTVYGASLVEDRFGNDNSAYFFNGTSDHIRVPNVPHLNFEDAITVSFWMKIVEFFSHRETYPISHGNWENRWKISIIPERKVRWTVKTSRGIKDLDSQAKLVKDTYYNVTALYDGNNFDIYIDGVLDNHSTYSGSILTTSIDLTIGQVLPNNAEYNFKGVLDDIRIYNYAVSEEEIKNIYSEHTAVSDPERGMLLYKTSLHQNYPNPFNATTAIGYELREAGYVTIHIYNVMGQRVHTLIDGEKQTGFHSVSWNGKDDEGQILASGLYFYEMKVGHFHQIRKLLMLK